MNTSYASFHSRYKKYHAQGFTIVELLIVIVVIAILAAISVVAYNGIQDRARATAIQSGLSTAAKKIELARIDSTDGLYPTAITSAMDIHVTKSVYNVSRNNWYYCTSSDRTQFAIGAAVQGDKGYIYSSNGSIVAANTVWGTQTCVAVGKSNGDSAWVGFNFSGGSGWHSALQG